MARRDDFRSSSPSLDSGGGRWDTERFTHERQERSSYRTTVTERERERERERPFDEDGFQRRLFEQERYGPPARRPERFYEDDHLDHHLDRSSPPPHHSGPLVSYGGGRSSPSPPPRLIRRQSSLDTFDRVPSRKTRDPYHRPEESDYRPRSSRTPPAVPPAPRSPARRSPPPGGRYYDDFYEDIRIAEPDRYGDEEFRNFRERERTVEHRRRRSHESIHEQVRMTEKPYPRKGKTRMPRRLVHTRAIIELGYPFEEEGDVVVIQKALSKEQIDEVVALSREIKRWSDTRPIPTIKAPSPVRDRKRESMAEHGVMDTYSPRSSLDALIVERTPSRRRSRSHVRSELLDRREVRDISRPRSASFHSHGRRRSSPVHIVKRHSGELLPAGPLVVQDRPRRSDREIRAEIQALEDERRMLQLERRDEIIRDTEFIDHRDREEIIEVRRDRKAPGSRLIRAMLATLT
ncbi:hypothetical protein VTN02DRAFT_2887 [Thermoascus thermophilus]